METPLEPLETKLARYIEEWRVADALYVDGSNPRKQEAIKEAASYNLARFIATHPEMVKGSSPDLPLVDTLLSLPTLIRDAQERFDKAERAYQSCLTDNAISALEQPIFKGKDDTLRVASNDTERKLAIDRILAFFEVANPVARERADALRELQCTKARFEAAKLMVQLVCKGNGK